jgi:LmbE family N-acetylglucosaminyl deacetylase
MASAARKTVLCIAPHPDDETLGCGGTLLRHIAEGDEVHWLIVTRISEEQGFSSQRVESRSREIETVAAAYGFAQVHRAGFLTTRLDQVAKGDLVGAVSEVIAAVRPTTLYIPYRNDVHSDHAAVFDAASSCTKSFRYPYIKQVYCYETLSETEFGVRPDDPGFRPNLFCEISQTLERKIEIMRLFEGEMGVFPFPRSEECIRAQAMLRGSVAGCRAAEAFMILRETR